MRRVHAAAERLSGFAPENRANKNKECGALMLATRAQLEGKKHNP